MYELFYGLPFGCDGKSVQVTVDIFHRCFRLLAPFLGNGIDRKLLVSEESEVALERLFVVCGKQMEYMFDVMFYFVVHAIGLLT